MRLIACTLAFLGTAAIMTGGLLGYFTAPGTERVPAAAGGVAAPAALKLHNGVPVGILDSPGGAVAAADNYISAQDNAITNQQDLHRVVSSDWAPPARARELSAWPGRATATLAKRNLKANVGAAVAADKLLSFSPAAATVSVYHELTVWQPASRSGAQQIWVFESLHLSWNKGQWWVAAAALADQAHTPMPEIVDAYPSATGADVSAELAGMTAPYYAAGTGAGR